MPSRGQNGGAMNDNLAQHAAPTPSPSTGSRQATHSVGSAMSSASRAVCRHAPRHARSAPRSWVEMERVGDASASMGVGERWLHRLSSRKAHGYAKTLTLRSGRLAASRRVATSGLSWFETRETALLTMRYRGGLPETLTPAYQTAMAPNPTAAPILF